MGAKSSDRPAGFESGRRRWGRAQRDRILDPYFDEGGYFVRMNWARSD